MDEAEDPVLSCHFDCPNWFDFSKHENYEERPADTRWFASLQPQLRTPQSLIDAEGKELPFALECTPNVKHRTPSTKHQVQHGKTSAKVVATKLQYSSDSDDEITEMLRAHNKKIHASNTHHIPGKHTGNVPGKPAANASSNLTDNVTGVSPDNVLSQPSRTFKPVKRVSSVPKPARNLNQQSSRLENKSPDNFIRKLPSPSDKTTCENGTKFSEKSGLPPTVKAVSNKRISFAPAAKAVPNKRISFAPRMGKIHSMNVPNNEQSKTLQNVPTKTSAVLVKSAPPIAKVSTCKTAAPSIKTAAPSIKTAAPNIKTSAPSIKTAAPNIKTAAPNIKTAASSIKTAASSSNSSTIKTVAPTKRKHFNTENTSASQMKKVAGPGASTTAKAAGHNALVTKSNVQQQSVSSKRKSYAPSQLSKGRIAAPKELDSVKENPSKSCSFQNRAVKAVPTKTSNHSQPDRSDSSTNRTKPVIKKPLTQLQNLPKNKRAGPFKASSTVLSIINTKTPVTVRRTAKTTVNKPRYSVETPSPPIAGGPLIEEESDDDFDALILEKLKAHNAKVGARMVSSNRIPGKSSKTGRQVSLHLGSPVKPKIKPACKR